MRSHWQLQEAKAKFSELVERALEGEPQLVTKRGENAVVVISHKQYIQVSQSGTSLLQALSGAPKGELVVSRDRTLVRTTKLE